MKLAGVELVRVDVPFRHDIGTAAGVHRTRPLLFVRVVTEEGEGWGESAALEGGTSVDPPLAEIERAAADRGVARLEGAARARGGHLPSGAEVPQLFGSSAVDRMLAATFEMAAWDAELRAEGRSMAQALGTGPGSRRCPWAPSSASRPTVTSGGCVRRSMPRCGPVRRGLASRSSPGGRSSRCAPSGRTTRTSCSRSMRTAPSAAARTTWRV